MAPPRERKPAPSFLTCPSAQGSGGRSVAHLFTVMGKGHKMIAGDCGAGAERSEKDEGARRWDLLVGNVYVALGLQQPIPPTLFFSPWRIKYLTTLRFSSAKEKVFNCWILKGIEHSQVRIWDLQNDQRDDNDVLKLLSR